MFVRLSGCNLRCSYCDSRYAWDDGERLELAEVVERVVDTPVNLVEITGGEPLLQERTPELCRVLQQWGRTVMVETNGTCDIRALPEGVIRVVDVKCPGSGAEIGFHMANLADLRPTDDCKFVISNRQDFDWARTFVDTHGLRERCEVIFTPVWQTLAPSTLAEWVLAEGANVRLGLQLHKVLWGDSRGK